MRIHFPEIRNGLKHQWATGDVRVSDRSEAQPESTRSVPTGVPSSDRVENSLRESIIHDTTVMP